ncbi:MAG: class I SAM-dependent methyltransferase, partial [Bdellovibrionota bacterium]
MTKRPTAGLYESSYFSNDNTPGYGDYESEFPAHYESFRSRITKSEFKLGRKGRLLDIGCALGHCGKAAQDLGWETYVTDASTFAVNHAAEKHDLKSFVTSGDHIPVKTDAFDCVTLFDVIEHVNDPKLLLTEIARTLNKDGMLHLSTPNVSSMSAKLMGRHWYHYKPGEHLLYFSPATLQRT